MVKFFLKTGDPQVDEAFMPYLWGEQGLRAFIETYTNTEDYGQGLKLLLIQVYVEGRFAVNGPNEVSVGNYSRVRQETSAAFTVRREDFQDRDDDERKAFLSAMVLRAVAEVERKHGQKARPYDFHALIESVATATEKYQGR